jgi:hypothetical protein
VWLRIAGAVDAGAALDPKISTSELIVGDFAGSLAPGSAALDQAKRAHGPFHRGSTRAARSST